MGSGVAACGLSCQEACRISPDQGSNWGPLHWKVDSLLLDHQGSPAFPTFYLFLTYALLFSLPSLHSPFKDKLLQESFSDYLASQTTRFSGLWWLYLPNNNKKKKMETEAVQRRDCHRDCFYVLLLAKEVSWCELWGQGSMSLCPSPATC